MDRNSAQADEKAFRSAALHLEPLNPQRREHRLISRSYGYRIPWVNHGATIFWHTDRMPDDDRFFPPRPAPERIELAAIKTDLEFAIGQLSRLHKQLARAALGITFCTAAVTTLLNWWLLSH